MFKKLASLTVLLALTACSNSGSGDGAAGVNVPSPVSFTPGELTALYTAGTWTELSFQAVVSNSVPDTAAVLLQDPDGVITSDATVVQNSSGSYDIRVKTSASVPPGRYTGALAMHLCKDLWCTEEYPGSPGKLPYDIRITRPPITIAFAPSSLTGALVSGSSSTLSFLAMTNDTFSGTIFVSFVDSGDVFLPDFGITANPSGSFTILAATDPSVAPGRHQGTIEMDMCADRACSSPLPGSPASLPYDIDVISSSPVSISFSPASLSGRYITGDSIDETFTATVTGILARSTYVKIVDADGILMSNPSVTTAGGGSYKVSAKTSSSAAPGRYQGNIEFLLCLDAACTRPYPGSPGLLPCDITVLSDTNITQLSPLAGAGDWETYQKNAVHTGYVPVTLDPASFSPRWKWTDPDSGVSLSPMAAANGLVYVSSSGYFAASSKLFALNEYDGTVQWSYDFGGVFALNPPAVSGGKVFAATSGHADTFMWAFPADTGAPILFKTAFSSQWDYYYAPTVENGAVYTDGGYYGGMNAFNVGDGSSKWFNNGLNQYDKWTPAVDASYAYVYLGTSCSNCANGGLNILNKSTGALVTRITDSSFNWSGWSVNGSPVIGPSSIYVVNGHTSSSRLLSFSTSTIKWSVAGYYPTNPALANGVLYIVNKSPYRLEARDETDGSLLWTWTPDGIGETDFAGNIVATDNLVFLSTNQRVYAVDLSTHLPVWSYGKPGDMAISSNGVLFIRASSGTGICSVNLH